MGPKSEEMSGKDITLLGAEGREKKRTGNGRRKTKAKGGRKK